MNVNSYNTDPYNIDQYYDNNQLSKDFDLSGFDSNQPQIRKSSQQLNQPYVNQTNMHQIGVNQQLNQVSENDQQITNQIPFTLNPIPIENQNLVYTSQYNINNNYNYNQPGNNNYYSNHPHLVKNLPHSPNNYSSYTSPRLIRCNGGVVPDRKRKLMNENSYEYPHKRQKTNNFNGQNFTNQRENDHNSMKKETTIKKTDEIYFETLQKLVNWTYYYYDAQKETFVMPHLPLNLEPNIVKQALINCFDQIALQQQSIIKRDHVIDKQNNIIDKLKDTINKQEEIIYNTKKQLLNNVRYQ